MYIVCVDAFLVMQSTLFLHNTNVVCTVVLFYFLTDGDRTLGQVRNNKNEQRVLVVEHQAL